MRVHLAGGGPLSAPLSERLEAAGHEPVRAEAAEVVLDLTPLDDSRERGWPDEARRYCLCWGASAGALAESDPHPWRVAGFSLLPPVSDASVVEIALPLQAPESLGDEVAAFFESLGLETALVPDGPGLIAARIVACLANEAVSALAEGVADAATIDRAMRLGTNYPRGPLEWADTIGPAAVLGILEGLQRDLGERYRPQPLLRRLAAAGLPLARPGVPR